LRSEYSKSDQSFLRLYNKKKLLNILRERGALSRVELAEISQLDRKTITNIVNEMLDDRQIVRQEMRQGSFGRPREMLARNADYGRSMGIDVGGTHITVAVLDFMGNLLSHVPLDLEDHGEPEGVLARCDDAVKTALAHAGLGMEHMEGIGVAFPGHIDPMTGRPALAESMPKWQNLSVPELFSRRYGKPVQAGDCSMLMAMAELWFGKGRDCKDFMVFDLGFGIGCGIVINGSIFAGCNGKAGEIGHTIVQVNGPTCKCGRRGCVEALASGWAIAKRGQEMIRANPSGILAGLCQGGSGVSSREIAMAAAAGDEGCRGLLIQAGETIGIGVANAMSLFNPMRVIIGGRLIIDNELMLGQIKRTIREKTIDVVYNDADITVSGLGQLASAMGAAAMCFEHYYV